MSDVGHLFMPLLTILCLLWRNVCLGPLSILWLLSWLLIFLAGHVGIQNKHYFPVSRAWSTFGPLRCEQNYCVVTSCVVCVLGEGQFWRSLLLISPQPHNASLPFSGCDRSAEAEFICNLNACVRWYSEHCINLCMNERYVILFIFKLFINCAPLYNASYGYGVAALYPTD